jgi:hypothetical protein
MAHELTAHVANAAASPKIATIVASATAGSGLASLFDVISSGLGLVAVVAGIVLTSILIRKHALEYKMLKRQAEAKYGRREEDQP